MSLQNKIDQDLKEALMARDGVRTSTLRFLKSALKYSAIEKKSAELADADIFQIINKQIKQHQESIAQFTQGGRAELVAKETAEVKILESYLPRQMSDTELDEIVRAAVRESGASSKKDFGRAMKLLTEKLAGKAEPRRISALLTKLLV